MLEIAALATQAVASFLVPFIKEGGKKLAETLRTRTTDAAADGIVGAAQRMWERLRGRTEGTPDAATLTRFEADPEDYQGSVEDLLRRLMKSDPDFEREMRDLLEAKESGTIRWQLAGDVVGAVELHEATFSGGSPTVAGVMYTAGSTSPSNRSSDTSEESTDAAGRRDRDGN
jgi:hypothetical protein